MSILLFNWDSSSMISLVLCLLSGCCYLLLETAGQLVVCSPSFVVVVPSRIVLYIRMLRIHAVQYVGVL